MLPEPAPSLAPQAAAAADGPGAGLGNPITAVLISYRSFDTMLEKIVLILAVVGVWSVGADAAWGSAPAPLGRRSPYGSMVFLAQMLAPVGALIGLHIFWVGADAPGGAFQGGALLAAMWMIAMMARLTEPPRVDSRRLRLALVAGPAVFLVIGLAGNVMDGSFFAYPAAFAKPIILFIEAFMLLSIAVALPMLVAGPPSGRRRAMTPSVLAGLVGAGLVGLGLYGLILHPHPLRKLLAFNLVGCGVFLVFGIVARRGAAAGLAFDPVPQAMVITGIVVAFAASALAVALILRLSQESGRVTLDPEALDRARRRGSAQS